jgi:hypothetical protein
MMSPKRRDLMFHVMDGVAETLPFLHHFDSQRRCEDILLWLIKNNLTGKNFISWAKTEFPGSILGITKFILGRLNQDKDYKVLYGRDLI